eukprot:NODE_383_length_8356_cov_0.477898.p5 type:complete len:143 gc:universal NODE_383_length_8356_cov_0.477898:8258-7830(-)
MCKTFKIKSFSQVELEWLIKQNKSRMSNAADLYAPIIIIILVLLFISMLACCICRSTCMKQAFHDMKEIRKLANTAYTNNPGDIPNTQNGGDQNNAFNAYEDDFRRFEVGIAVQVDNNYESGGCDNGYSGGNDTSSPSNNQD